MPPPTETSTGNGSVAGTAVTDQGLIQMVKFVADRAPEKTPLIIASAVLVAGGIGMYAASFGSRSSFDKLVGVLEQRLASTVDRDEKRALELRLAELVSTELGDHGRDHVGALEDVLVVQQVGLHRQDLLDPQAPLLVPRAGEAHGLVPGGKLESAGPGIPRQGHREGL